jgi:hypothetical protein
MERDKTPTVDLTDQELEQASGGSNPLIDAFVQGIQKGSTEGAGGIGSQSTGAGAGKVTFNPFSITRRIDTSTP